MVEQAPHEADKFYDTEEAYARYMRLAEAAEIKAAKAEKRRQAAAKRREEASTDYASNELFAVPTEFDPTAKSHAKEEMLAAEKELEEAEEEVMETRKAAATAAAAAMKAAREMEEHELEQQNAALEASKNGGAYIKSGGTDNHSLAGSEEDDSSLAGMKSEEEALRAQQKADQAAKDAEQMGDIKERCVQDPAAHAEEVKLAYETFNEVSILKEIEE